MGSECWQCLKTVNQNNEMINGLLPSEQNNNKISDNDLFNNNNIDQNYDYVQSMESNYNNSEHYLSEQIFNIFNDIRNNPKNYLSTSQKYDLFQIISSAKKRAEEGSIKNLIKNPFFDLFFEKCVKAYPNSKEGILKSIEKENLFKEFEKNLYIEEGSKEKMEECVWNLLKNCANNSEDILGKDITYLVVSTFTLNDNNKFMCYFLFLYSNKENNNKYEYI